MQYYKVDMHLIASIRVDAKSPEDAVERMRVLDTTDIKIDEPWFESGSVTPDFDLPITLCKPDGDGEHASMASVFAITQFVKAISRMTLPDEVETISLEEYDSGISPDVADAEALRSLIRQARTITQDLP